MTDQKTIDLIVIFKILIRHWWLILLITCVGSVLSVVYALSLPNVYKATTTLAPSVEVEGGGLASLAGRFSGLATLTGVNLNKSSVDEVDVAIEIMRSRQFIKEFIDKHDIAIPLMASKKWQKTSNTLVIDDELVNPDSQEWIVSEEGSNQDEIPYPVGPTHLEMYQVFLNNLSVSKDKSTGLIYVSFKHVSPYIAHEWVSLLVKDLNLKMKQDDVIEAKKSIEFIKNQLEKTSVAGMKTVFYQMIEEQTKTILLSEVREEYIFKTIDPPVVPETKESPNRTFLCLLMTFLSGFLACGLVVFGVLIRDKQAHFSSIRARPVFSA